MKTLIQQTDRTEAFFPLDEREFSERKLVGAVTRIKMDDKKKIVCYEGERDGKESFIEQSPNGEINSWRCRLKYLEFVSSLPEGLGERAVYLDNIHMNLVKYSKNAAEYFEAAVLLFRAGLWRAS